MDILSSLDYAQLGVAGMFIAYLIWTIQGYKEEIVAARLREEAWQERCFNTVNDSFLKVSDAVNTIDQAISFLERN